MKHSIVIGANIFGAIFKKRQSEHLSWRRQSYSCCVGRKLRIVIADHPFKNTLKNCQRLQESAVENKIINLTYKKLIFGNSMNGDY